MVFPPVNVNWVTDTTLRVKTQRIASWRGLLWKSPDEALVSRVKLLVEAKLTYLNKLTQHELWASASKPTLTVTVRTVTFILILFTYYLWYYSETHWLNELFIHLSKLTLPVYCQCWVVYHTICRLTIAPLVLWLNTSTLTAVSLHLSRFDPDRVKIKRAFCRTGSRWRSEFTSSTLRFTPRDVSTLRCAPLIWGQFGALRRCGGNESEAETLIRDQPDLQTALFAFPSAA